MSPALAWLCSADPFVGGELLRAWRPSQIINKRWGWPVAVGRNLATGDDGLYLVTPNGQPVRPEVLIVRPVRNMRAWHVQAGRMAGQIVIGDLDDDLWAHEHQGNESFVRRAENLLGEDFYDEWYRHTDAMLVSTQPIADSLRHQGYDKPIVVAPNCYDCFGPANISGLANGPGTRIGTRLFVSGRMSPDLLLYDQLVYPLLDELGLTFVHLGANQRTGDTFAARGWSLDHLEQHDVIPQPLMCQVLSTLNVGMICLGEHAYNKAKTLTHPAELAACGLPLVAATDDPLYSSVPGRVPATIDAVRDRLLRLRSARDWQREQRRALEWVRILAYQSEQAYLAGLSSLLSELCGTIPAR